jgi:CheY-like chemotaxis protein
MTEHRPKLLVLEGPLVPGAELALVLGDRYDVAVAPAGVGAAKLATGGFQVVFGGAGDLASNENFLSDRDAGAVLGAIGEGLCLATAEGQILWANRRFRAYDEQTRARIGSACRMAARRFESVLQASAPGPCELVDAGDKGPGRFDVASADEARFYEVVISPVIAATDLSGPSAERDHATGAARKVDRVAAVVWDVTAARRMQQKMDAIDRAGSELVRLDAGSIRKMHVGERLKLLEEKIVKFSHDLLHFDHLAVRLLDERTGKLELVMASGLPREAMEVELYATREGNGIMGYVAATGRSYLCADVTKDPRYVVGLHGARSSLTVPLRINDKVVGAFNVESERINAFTEEDRQFAEIFATHIALALHILDLLVVERCATGESVAGTVQGELNEPLEDIVHEVDWLMKAAGSDAKLREHVDRIRSDVEAIRRRVKEAAEGPQNILGAEKALADLAVDPLLAGKRVLVADDEARIRQTIREMLRARGCEVVACENGARAIEELEKTTGAGPGGAMVNPEKKFDLVISDIKMPDRNGYEVFAAARRVDASLPVILMTGFGYDPHHSIVRASQEGLQCVLFKPFQAERLVEEVRKALGVSAGA